MKVLKEHERKNGYDYYLVERNENYAVYKQTDETNDIYAFEVFKIKNRKETEIKGRKIEAGEVFPGNEEFGKTAWSIPVFSCNFLSENEQKIRINNALDKAYKKFEELTLNYENGKLSETE